MSVMHNCSECRYLTRTSPTQVFLLCRYWSSRHGVRGDYDYVITHCHMQPEAPACGAFRPREVTPCDGSAQALATA